MPQPPADHRYDTVPPHLAQQPHLGQLQPRPTETMAVLALVFAFVFPPLGIVFGVIARGSITRTGREGWGLATAGLWTGVAITALWVVLFAVVFVLPFVMALLLLAVGGSTAP